MLDLWGNEIENVPGKRRDSTNATRQAIFVAMRSDLGDIPPCANPERRERCRRSLVDFGLTYCRAWLPRDPSPAMVDYAETLQRAIESGGLVHVRLPRGFGKTTWIRIAVAWGVTYGILHYPVLFQAGAALSSAILEDIWSLFEQGVEYGEDNPAVSVPIRALEGMYQRAAGQHYRGVRTRIRRTATQICLPVIEGSEASGAIIVARGAGQACRGMVRGSLRPDFVLLDDIQTRADAMSAMRVGRLCSWIQQDVMGLASGQQLAAAMASTPIALGDVSDLYADRAAHPEWRLVEHRLVESWAEREDLWERYDALWADDLARGDSTAETATAFYDAHRDAMDAGARCIDEALFDARTERSAIQHARNLLLRTGRVAFGAEYQLEPPREDASLAVEVADVQRAHNGTPRGNLPPGTLVPLGFVDVMADKLHWAVLAFGRRQTAAVIDYGVWPEQGRATPRNGTERDIEAALARALVALSQKLYGTVYRRADGGAARLHALWYDCGWQTVVVHRVAALMRARGHANTWGCRGYASTGFLASSRRVVVSGPDVDMREREGQRWAAQNSDVFREATQRAFLGAPGAPGSLSVWGSDGAEHYAYGSHIAAERLADKAQSGRGVTLYRWTLRPGAANHWLDATSGCIAMGAFYRFWDARDIAAEAARAVRGESAGAPPARAARAPGSAPRIAARQTARPRMYSARRRMA